jgi:hypothetical protein
VFINCRDKRSYFYCPSPAAIEHRHLCLQLFLRNMSKIGTPAYLSATFKYKLMLTLNLPFSPSHSYENCESVEVRSTLLLAIHHQNVIGWDNFHSPPSSFDHQRDEKLINLTSSLLKDIWAGRNAHLHGISWREAKQKFRERIQAEVQHLYLSSRPKGEGHPNTHSIPLEDLLQQSTTNLQRWMGRVDHQRHVSKYIRQGNTSRQLTLWQAYNLAPSNISQTHTYPP